MPQKFIYWLLKISIFTFSFVCNILVVKILNFLPKATACYRYHMECLLMVYTYIKFKECIRNLLEWGFKLKIFQFILLVPLENLQIFSWVNKRLFGSTKIIRQHLLKEENFLMQYGKSKESFAKWLVFRQLSYYVKREQCFFSGV